MHPSYPAEPLQRRRRRANTYRAPPVPPSHLSSSSPSPPPHHRHRRPSHISPQNSVPDSRDPYNDYYAPRRRHSREEDYYSDSRHNRPPRDPYHDRPPRSKHHKPPREHREHGEIRERPQESERLTAHPSHERRASKWQQEAKNMFVEYAVPAIKAEGGKYLSKQIGNFIAKKA
ncbi:hypothetical protein CC80DRAFT_109897 [Byssothecium circinans]|uniref:Uncharacterized protein n=1 Tax=Byssothecium circinans TaxID=147558 RepID=A0A6A5TTI1_9PLEO|nr:hypothetical protein CC80DRAFT_109897 [Byssothecium circinans]